MPRHIPSLCAVPMIVLILAANLAGQAASRPRGAKAEAQKPGPKRFKGGYGQPTRLQIDVFELICTAEQARQFDVEKIRAGPPERAAVRERLAAFGDVGSVARLDTVVDLTREVRLANGARVLVFMPKKRGGYSREYEHIGCSIRLEGQWRAGGQAPTADAQVEIEAAHIMGAALEPTPDAKMPTFIETACEETVVLESGKPTYLVGRVTKRKPADGEDARILLSVTRLVATRLPSRGESDVGPVESSKPAERVEATGPQPTHVALAVYEVSGKPEDLLGLDVEKVLAGGVRDYDILRSLQQVGSTKVLIKLEKDFDLTADWNLKEGIEVPVPMGFKVTPDKKRGPRYVMYPDSVVVGVQGEWMAATDPARAMVDLNVRRTDVVMLRSEADPRLRMPSRAKCGVEQDVEVVSGRPLALAWSNVTTPDENDVMTLVIARLTLTRDGAADGPSKQANRAKAVATVLGQDSRLQIDAFEVSLAPGTVEGLDPDKLAAEAATPEALLRHLARLGPTRVVGHADERVHLAGEASVEGRGRAMIVTSAHTGAGGRVTPALDGVALWYALSARGEWRDGEEPSVADLCFDYSASGLVETGRELGPDLPLKALTSLSLRQYLRVESGKPVVMIATLPAAAGGADRNHHVTIIRLVATRMAD